MEKKFALHAPRVSYYHGGAERFILNLLTESFNQKRDITLVTYDAPKKSEWFKKFFKKYKKNIILIKSNKLDKNFSEFKLATKPSQWDRESRLFSEKANKIYSINNFTDISYHYAVDCLYCPRDKIIHLHLHGLPDKKRKIESVAIKNTNQIIAVSNYVGNGWKKLHNIRKEINVVHNAINPAVSKINKKRSNDILYFGRLIKIKGVNTLIESLKIISEQNIKFKTTIIGEGPERQYLEKLAKKLDVYKNIKFLGRVDDNTLKKNIYSSKLSIFPSYKREGVMTTLLEAMNMGSVVVAASACSNNEIIIDKKNGFLFEAKNSKQLSSIIGELLKNKTLINNCSINAKKTLEKFSWESQTKKTWVIFNA